VVFISSVWICCLYSAVLLLLLRNAISLSSPVSLLVVTCSLLHSLRQAMRWERGRIAENFIAKGWLDRRLFDEHGDDAALLSIEVMT